MANRKISVHVCDGFNDPAAIIELIEQILTPALPPHIKKINIIASNDNTVSRTYLSRAKETFRILLYCQVENALFHEQESPAGLWGWDVFDYDIDWDDRGFTATNPENAITDGATGYVAGELVGHNLLVHFDPIYLTGENQTGVFRALLEATVEKLKLVNRPAKKRDRMKVKSAKQLYVDACAGRKQTLLDSLRQSLEQSEQQLAKTRTQLVQLIRDTKDIRTQLQHIEQDGVGLRSRFEAEYDQLVAMKKIKKITVDEHKQIMVETEPLYCYSNYYKKTYDIGRFRITIDTTGKKNVHWRNLTRRVRGYMEGMQAPHIWPEGNACYGSAESSFIEALAAHDYLTVIQLAILFVESVNESDSAGIHINCWPEVKTKKDSVKKQN